MTNKSHVTLEIEKGFIANISTKTGDHTITSDDYTIMADASSSAVTLTLPSSPEAGRIYHIKCIDNTNTVTLDSNGNNIDGDSSNIILIEYETITVQSDGSDWYIL